MFVYNSPYSPFFTSGLLSKSQRSIRSIPSPKPAPSITLPEPPKQRAPPRIPSLVPIPALEFPLPLTISRTPAPPVTNVRRATSTVSTRIRRSNRSEALARLEGRSKRPPVMVTEQRRNFMYMSDEESDLDEDDVFPNPVWEPEDLVLPICPSIKAIKSAPPSYKNDWFPLKSFIDLHNDDDSSSWTWRNFIQVANVS